MCLIIQTHLTICPTAAWFIPQDSTQELSYQEKNMMPSKTPSSQQVIPSFSSGKPFCLVLSYQQERSFTVLKYWGFFCSYWVQYPAISVSYFVFVFSMHFSLQAQSHAGCHQFSIISSYIVYGFSSPQSCHSQPAQNHPSTGEKKALSSYFGFSGTKNIVQIFFFFHRKITDFRLRA